MKSEVSKNERWIQVTNCSLAFILHDAVGTKKREDREVRWCWRWDYRTYIVINQLFTSAQHLLLLIIGHVSTDHSIIFRSLICCKFKDLKMTEWSVETCSPIISSNKCCADVNNWLIIYLSTSWCLYTNILWIWHSEDRASSYILITKPTRCTNF